MRSSESICIISVWSVESRVKWPSEFFHQPLVTCAAASGKCGRIFSVEERSRLARTTLRFGELEALLADINEIPSVQRTSFQARLKDLQRQGLLRMDELPRGKAAAYG